MYPPPVARHKSAKEDAILQACAWRDGGAEFVFEDGTVLVFRGEMSTFVALPPPPDPSSHDPVAERMAAVSSLPSTRSVYTPRDASHTALALSPYRHKVRAALLLYNRFTAHPQLLASLYEDEESVYTVEGKHRRPLCSPQPGFVGEPASTSLFSRPGGVRDGRAENHEEPDVEHAGGATYAPHARRLPLPSSSSSFLPPPSMAGYYLAKDMSLLERRAVLAACLPHAGVMDVDAISAVVFSKGKIHPAGVSFHTTTEETTNLIREEEEEERTKTTSTSSLSSRLPTSFPVREEELTLWCVHHCVSLTLHWHRQLFTVRWPLYVEPQGTRCPSPSSSSPSLWNAGWKRETEVEKGFQRDDTTTTTAGPCWWMEQVFPVAAPPTEWAGMLALLWTMAMEEELHERGRLPLSTTTATTTRREETETGGRYPAGFPMGAPDLCGSRASPQAWTFFPFPRQAYTISHTEHPSFPLFSPAEPCHRLLLQMASDVAVASCQAALHPLIPPPSSSSSIISAVPPGLLWEWRRTTRDGSRRWERRSVAAPSEATEMACHEVQGGAGEEGSLFSSSSWREHSHRRMATSPLAKRPAALSHVPVGVMYWYTPPPSPSSSPFSFSTHPLPSPSLLIPRSSTRVEHQVDPTAHTRAASHHHLPLPPMADRETPVPAEEEAHILAVPLAPLAVLPPLKLYAACLMDRTSRSFFETHGSHRHRTEFNPPFPPSTSVSLSWGFTSSPSFHAPQDRPTGMPSTRIASRPSGYTHEEKGEGAVKHTAGGSSVSSSSWVIHLRRVGSQPKMYTCGGEASVGLYGSDGVGSAMEVHPMSSSPSPFLNPLPFPVAGTRGGTLHLPHRRLSLSCGTRSLCVLPAWAMAAVGGPLALVLPASQQTPQTRILRLGEEAVYALYTIPWRNPMEEEARFGANAPVTSTHRDGSSPSTKCAASGWERARGCSRPLPVTSAFTSFLHGNPEEEIQERQGTVASPHGITKEWECQEAHHLFHHHHPTQLPPPPPPWSDWRTLRAAVFADMAAHAIRLLSEGPPEWKRWERQRSTWWVAPSVENATREDGKGSATTLQGAPGWDSLWSPLGTSQERARNAHLDPTCSPSSSFLF